MFGGVSQITERYYVKKDTAYLSGITDGQRDVNAQQFVFHILLYISFRFSFLINICSCKSNSNFLLNSVTSKLRVSNDFPL